MKTFLGKYQNYILAGVYLLVLIFFVSSRYDYYFALNDDVLMKDILAGIYTGTPEPRNIQMLFPLSLFISLFYRVIPAVPWYGLFLLLCQFGSIFLIALLSLKFIRTIFKKILLLVLQFIIITATMLEHLVFVQYTITSAMLTTAAVFCFIASDGSAPIKAFIKANLLPIILILIAFLLRPWMLLLLLPFVLVAGIFKLSQEKPAFTKLNFAKYFALFGVLLLMLLASQTIDLIATSSKEWRKFNQFFANRTELYDFQSIPEYDANVTFYHSLGFTYGEVNLLKNYNFGLSAKIDERTLGEIAGYAGERRNENLSFKERFNQQLRLYAFLLTNGGEHGHYPYNSLILLGYAMLIGLANFYSRFWRSIGIISLLISVRSLLWLFILMGERYPPRLSHSLYFIEMGILLLMILAESVTPADKKAKSFNKSFPAVMALVALIIALGNVPAMLNRTAAELETRETTNQAWLLMQEYTSTRPGNFYFIDVYSSVQYSEKLLAKMVKRPANYDIMGGWAVNSPLHQKKLNRLIAPEITMFEALLRYDNVYFINDIKFDIDWLSAYYAERGEIIAPERIDLIADKLEVYKLR
ncbi:MAG: hypothetical protein FWG91_10850 [Lachnospiraceae bacterium]|nr:hypothetical protein [Lachnospiraceae bacterium]